MGEYRLEEYGVDIKKSLLYIYYRHIPSGKKYRHRIHLTPNSNLKQTTQDILDKHSRYFDHLTNAYERLYSIIVQWHHQRRLEISSSSDSEPSQGVAERYSGYHYRADTRPTEQHQKNAGSEERKETDENIFDQELDDILDEFTERSPATIRGASSPTTTHTANTANVVSANKEKTANGANEDYNKLSSEELENIKKKMDVEFQRNKIDANDANFVYDVRKEFAPDSDAENFDSD